MKNHHDKNTLGLLKSQDMASLLEAGEMVLRSSTDIFTSCTLKKTKFSFYRYYSIVALKVKTQQDFRKHNISQNKTAFHKTHFRKHVSENITSDKTQSRFAKQNIE